MAFTIDGTNGLTFNNATTQNSGGKVLQVVNATYATQVSNSTSTFADTGLTATITPLFATSKILVMISQSNVVKDVANASTQVAIKLLRGATDLGNLLTQGGYTGTGVAIPMASFSINYLDSPATTSATTYKTQFNNAANVSQVIVQSGSSTSTITLMEIAV